MSDNDRTYNGWTNYETWAVNLWLTNDYGSDRYWRDRVTEIAEDYEWDHVGDESPKEYCARILADELKDQTEELAPELPGPYCDLLAGAIGEVNWYEIATALAE